MTFSRRLLAKAALGPLLSIAVIADIRGGLIPGYQAYSVGLAATYTIMVLSVGLLAGWAGVWSVGHPALFARCWWTRCTRASRRSPGTA